MTTKGNGDIHGFTVELIDASAMKQDFAHFGKELSKSSIAQAEAVARDEGGILKISIPPDKLSQYGYKGFLEEARKLGFAPLETINSPTAGRGVDYFTPANEMIELAVGFTMCTTAHGEALKKEKSSRSPGR